MSDKSKKIFLAICVIVPFIIYCVIYYSSMVKNAPFRYSDFESIELSYGYPNEMVNTFNSKTGVHQYLTTGVHQYLTKDNKLETNTIKMRDNDLLYLHRKAQELGFWNVDDDMTNHDRDTTVQAQVPRYKLKFTYKEKSKEVTLDADYNGEPKMKDAAKTTIDAVMKMIADVSAR